LRVWKARTHTWSINKSPSESGLEGCDIYKNYGLHFYYQNSWK
jgi:hypothetical protein